MVTLNCTEDSPLLCFLYDKSLCFTKAGAHRLKTNTTSRKGWERVIFVVILDGQEDPFLKICFCNILFPLFT